MELWHGAAGSKTKKTRRAATTTSTAAIGPQDSDDEGDGDSEAEEESDEQEAEQRWAHCDACGKWRRLPESMRGSDELDEAWTCAMHPDPALRGCEVAEEGLGKDEVTTLVEVQEQGSCGTPGCTLADFHLGPCSNATVSGGRRNRGRHSK